MEGASPCCVSVTPGERPQPGQRPHPVILAPCCVQSKTDSSLTSSCPQSPAPTLLLEDEACWLRTLPRALTEAEANAEIHRKGQYRCFPAAF